MENKIASEVDVPKLIMNLMSPAVRRNTGEHSPMRRMVGGPAAKKALERAKWFEREGWLTAAANARLELGDRIGAAKLYEAQGQALSGPYIDAATLWLELGDKKRAEKCAEICERKGRGWLFDAAAIRVQLGHREATERCVAAYDKETQYGIRKIWLQLGEKAAISYEKRGWFAYAANIHIIMGNKEGAERCAQELRMRREMADAKRIHGLLEEKSRVQTISKLNGLHRKE